MGHCDGAIGHNGTATGLGFFLAVAAPACPGPSLSCPTITGLACFLLLLFLFLQQAPGFNLATTYILRSSLVWLGWVGPGYRP